MSAPFSAASIVVCVVGLTFSAACKPQPKKPGEQAFDAASRAITSSESGVAHGNTEACKGRAELLSSVLWRMDKVGFAGGKDNGGVSLTGEQFLVYCQHSVHGVAFLVHVPQFKRYQDGVRAELAKLAWAASELVTQDLAEEGPLRLAVGLRGSAFYGAILVGEHSTEPSADLASIAKAEPLFAYFERPRAAEAPMSPQVAKTAEAIVHAAEAEPR